MRILISTIVWGKNYFDNFCDYALASLLSPENIPAAAAAHEITFLLITEEKRIVEFQNTPVFKRLSSIAKFEFIALEAHGFNPTRIPSGFHTQKYNFLSLCQNIAIERSLGFDIHIFNYADFIWADGALSGLIAKCTREDFFALLGFCVPVEEKKTKSVLDQKRGNIETPITLPAREAVALALANLHSEAKLRAWEKPRISSFPSYLFWAVGEEGAIFRAFHQTLLAVCPSRGSAVYQQGIQHGTLDGSFSSEIAAAEPFSVATDSDEIFIFSMHHSFTNTKSECRDKRKTLARFIANHVTPQHFTNFSVPILLKSSANYTPTAWNNIIATSLGEIEPLRVGIQASTSHHSNTLAAFPSWKNPKNCSGPKTLLSNWLLPPIKYYIRRTLGRLARKLGLR